MGHDYRRSNRGPGASTSVTGSVGTPGKRTLTEALSADAAPVQRKATGAAPDDHDHVHEAAQRGVAGGGSALPHLDVIQRAFGPHDVSKIQAHTGDAAARSSTEIGARAYATGNHVAFAGVPDLRTTAHEAAHVVQQRAGVHLKGAVGDTGDAYERNADEVAECVVRGESAADLLPSGGSSPGSAVQRIDAGAKGDELANKPAPTATATGPVVKAGVDLTVIGQEKGIRIAIAFAHDAGAERPGKVAKFQGGQLRDQLNQLWVQLGWLGEVVALKAALDKEDADAKAANTAAMPTTRAPTAAEAGTLADAVFKNDAAFVANAIPHANLRHSIGGPPPKADAHIPYKEGEDPFTAIAAVSTAIGPLSTNKTASDGGTPMPGAVPASPPPTLPPGITQGPAVAAGNGNIAELAVFTHGTHHSMGFGGAGWLGGDAVAGKIAQYAAPQISVQLYGCSSAAKDKESDPNEMSFAQALTNKLGEQGHDSRVFGHNSAGPTVDNPDGREFATTTDGHGGYVMLTKKNYDICFPSSFVAGETTRLAAALSSTADIVGSVFEPVASRWTTGALSRVAVASAGGKKALYVIGFDRDAAVAAIQADWQTAAQGEAAIKADKTFIAKQKAPKAP
jgi:hypothetical protein